MIDLIYWFSEIGTNDIVMGILDKNSVLLLAGWGILMMVLRYRAKQTETTADDEFVNEIDNTVKGWFQRSVQKQSLKNGG